MSERLVLWIEIADFNVDEIRAAAEWLPTHRLSPTDAIDEEIENAMQCDEEVVVVFHRTDEVDGHILEHLSGRIRLRRLLEAS